MYDAHFLRPARSGARGLRAACAAFLFAAVAAAAASERWDAGWDDAAWPAPATDPAPAFGWFADGPQPPRPHAALTVGGEAFIDLTYKSRDRAPATDAFGVRDVRDGRMRRTGFEATTANLRFKVEPSAASNMKWLLKLSLNDAWNRGGDVDQDDLLEECRFVFEDIGGSGWSLVFGKGEAPFGQDRALGIIQSYGHNADRYWSSEGVSSLLADPDWVAGQAGGPVGRSGEADRFPHPGEIDRAFFAGATYRWRETLQVEFAVFQNDRRLDGARRSADGMQSYALRVWWTPAENLTLQASGVRRHSRFRGRAENREDLDNPDDATNAEYALSVGAEWTPGRLELWGEYLRGWRWNNTRGYQTSQLGLGGRWHFTDAWSAGLMAEWLRLRDPRNGMNREDYYKLVAGVQYTTANGLFVLGEVGREWFRGKYDDRDHLRAFATLIGLRLGWQF